jgi:hypothetical protein
MTLSLLAGGCFPNNPKHQTIAKVVEGGLAIGGIALLASVNTGADCMGQVAGDVDQACEDKAQLLSGIGLGMVLTGLVGFIVTVSTAGDDAPATTTSVTPKPATDGAPSTTPSPVAPPTPPAPTPPEAPAPATPPETPAS